MNFRHQLARECYASSRSLFGVHVCAQMPCVLIQPCGWCFYGMSERSANFLSFNIYLFVTSYHEIWRSKDAIYRSSIHPKKQSSLLFALCILTMIYVYMLVVASNFKRHYTVILWTGKLTDEGLWTQAHVHLNIRLGKRQVTALNVLYSSITIVRPTWHALLLV